MSRGIVFVAAFALALSAGLFFAPAAHATFQGAAVVLTPGLYTGTNTYVPGETMTVTAYATVGDVLDFQFWNAATGIPTYTIGNQTVGTSGQKVVQFAIPASWADGNTYQVRVTDVTSAQIRVRAFAIETYNFRVWTDRSAYLPGDTVVVSWSATLIKDGSPAPSGVGDLQAYTAGGTNLMPAPGHYALNASQGSFSFALATTLPPYQDATAYGWFNDTAGLRIYADVSDFAIGNLRLTVGTDQGTYAPGGIVTVDITSRVQVSPFGPGPFDPTEPGIVVNVTVSDLATGNPVAAYGATNLVTDAHGRVAYLFQLNATPATATYQVTAEGTANGVITVSQGTTFNVASTTTITVLLKLDKSQYLSGDVITGTATAAPAGTYTYSWTVTDTTSFPGTTLAVSSGPSGTYTYAIPATFAGSIQVSVYANDGLGHVSPTFSRTVGVAFGYLALSLDRTEYNPGDTITATFSLVHGSAVLTNPTYYYKVEDNSGQMVASGNANGNSVSFTTPNPASSSYTFTITASQDGRTVEGTASAFQVSGFLLGISLDKTSYMPGDTIRVTYTITPRGTSVLPIQFRFQVWLFGGSATQVTTTSSTGVLGLVVPQGTSSGDLILYVAEFNTGAQVYNIVHIGAVNPLQSEVAGIPLYSILLTLLVIVLLLAVVLLWRRTGMGLGAKAAGTGRPTPPPPPPSGPTHPAGAGPMSVSCQHCGASIEITTSKRPIEVMCPSCGETQVVQ